MKKFFNWLVSLKPVKSLMKIPLVGKLLTWEIFSYLVFGVLTTLVSFGAYFIFDKIHFAVAGTEMTSVTLFRIGMDFTLATVANIVSWIAAVAFAFVTNKIYVFESRSWKPTAVLKELTGFVAGRLLTLVLFETLLFNFMSLHINDYVAKILVSVFVVIFNYVFSKLLVFRKKK